MFFFFFYLGRPKGENGGGGLQLRSGFLTVYGSGCICFLIPGIGSADMLEFWDECST